MYAAVVAPRPGRVFAITGPVHRVAGYTEMFGSTIFGDTVTACGLTLPWGSIVGSTMRHHLNSPSICGDCFPRRFPA